MSTVTCFRLATLHTAPLQYHRCPRYQATSSRTSIANTLGTDPARGSDRQSTKFHST